MHQEIWQPKDIEFVFQSYSKYEERLLEFLKILPYNDKNKESWSPELVSLFLDICGLIDSIARYVLNDGEIDSTVKINISNKDGKIIEKKASDLNITDFKLNIFDKFKFNEYRVVLYLYSTYPNCLITPYEYITYKNGKESIIWWDVYNSLKHNRLDNYEKANINNVIKSLSALFLFITVYKKEEFTKAMLRHEWLKTGWVPEAVHGERLSWPGQFWYETSLFGGSSDLKNFNSTNIGNIPASIANQSKKLTNFIGKYNR